jgi:hypothetical protein
MPKPALKPRIFINKLWSFWWFFPQFCVKYRHLVVPQNFTKETLINYRTQSYFMRTRIEETEGSPFLGLVYGAILVIL